MIELVPQIGSKKNSMLPFHITNRKSAGTKHVSSGANKEIALVRSFCKNELCNPNGLFVPLGFFTLFFILHHLHRHHCKRLALINYHLICLTFKRYA